MDKKKLEDILAPVSIATSRARERTVKSEFWSKFKSFAGRLPFAEDVAAAYFCAVDTNTPMRVRGTLLAALAYFILPLDAVPDIFAFVGFTDDIAVLTAAFTLMRGSINDEHREQARDAIAKLKDSA